MTPLTAIKGIGEKRADVFRQAGIASAEALLSYFPRDYLDCTVPVAVDSLYQGQMAFVRVAVEAAPRVSRFGGKTLVTARTADASGKLLLKWFNQPYRAGQLAMGQTVYACGRADLSHGRAIWNAALMEDAPGIVPVYGQIPGIGQKVLRDTIRAALSICRVSEVLPERILEKYGFLSAREAVRSIHFPADFAALAQAKTRIAFETAFFYLLAVELRRRERVNYKGTAFQMDGVEAAFLARLPFAPTNAQRRAISEIARDMAAKSPMNRLLQGDVGSGKTAVGMFAMLAAQKNGYQSLLLAPTEILAEQHMRTLSAFFGESVCLLTGGLKKKERDAALDRIASGEADIVVGTHALISEGVRFHKLGLVITDEQHRFGVQQRARAAEKGRDADMLVMSATPIPRTLALMMLSDLDLSVLDELPPGRLKIKTSYIELSKRVDMYQYIARRAAEGAQAYVVCPFIEDAEELSGMSATSVYEELKDFLPDVPIALLHGKQKKRVRDAAMEGFVRGETKILVTTTVIEVGVDVPNATIMAIESADRFGLAQLHQLRGRVGRGRDQSYCFLLSDKPGQTARERIKVMTQTNDGFAIAERDLMLRGAGELIGTEQHGQGIWQWILGLGDAKLIAAARETADEVFAVPTIEHNALCAEAERRYLDANEKIVLN